MTTSTDIKPFMDRVERDLLDRPARALIAWGVALLAGGVGTIIILARGEDTYARYGDRYDGIAAIAAVVGGICVVAAVILRVLQRGRREEIRQELHRELGAIETERARRDLRLLDAAEEVLNLMHVRRAREAQLRKEQNAVAELDDAFVDELSAQADGKVTRLIRPPAPNDRPKRT